MKKGMPFSGDVVRTEFPNKGIVYVEDRRVIVKGALEGQKVSGTIKKVRKDKAEGRLLEVEEKSILEDAKPVCVHFGACGGCTYQTMSIENQMKLKESQVKRLLDATESDYEWNGIKASPMPYEYRNKMEFSFGDEVKDGPMSLGMHKKNSFHDIVSITGCKIVSEDFNTIVNNTLDFCNERGYVFYKKMLHTGLLRHLVLRKSVRYNTILVNIVTTSQSEFNEEEYVAMINALKLEGKIAGIIHTINDRLADAVIADEMRVLYGDAYIYEEILGLKFKISPFSFFQTNSKGAEVLYETAREYIGDAKDKVVFDLYSGTGTIAQMLAKVAAKVVGVEIVEEAVEAAKINAGINELSNCEFIAGDVLKVLDEIEQKPDIIVLDPPRAGINPKAIKKIAGYDVDEMVYISCNPVSLAQDIEAFREYGYYLVKAQCVDMFVGNPNVETVTLLRKNRSMNIDVK